MSKVKLHKELYTPAVTMQDLVDILSSNDYDVLFEFIKELDAQMQDWGFTERLYSHFNDLHKVFVKECSE